MKTQLLPFLLLFSISGLAVGQAQEVLPEAIANWPAPPLWSPPAGARAGPAAPTGRKRSDDKTPLQRETASPPLHFVAITPCRIADTRGNGFTGQAGLPTLTANMPRDFQIGGTVPGVPAQCGIPAGAAAASFNFAIVAPSAAGNLVVYPQGSPAPTVSSLNWQAEFAALSNAAVIPLGGSPGSIAVDVNGPRARRSIWSSTSMGTTRAG